MKKAIIIILIILAVGGGAYGGLVYYNGRPTTIINNGNASNTNILTNQEFNANLNETILSMPVPRTDWNTAYNSGRATIPSSPAAGEAECVAKKDVTDMNQCLTTLALGFADPHFCEQLDVTYPDPKAVDQFAADIGCIQGYVKIYGPYDCAYHANATTADRCYYTHGVPSLIANPTRDCTKILSTALRQNCEDRNKEFDAAAPNRQNVNDTIMVLCLLSQDATQNIYFPQGAIRDEFVNAAAPLKTNCAQQSFFPDSERQRIMTLLNTDGDKDGLNLYLEKTLTSSDSKTDSDGDGYSDLNEVQNGYSPVGPGKLNGSLVGNVNGS